MFTFPFEDNTPFVKATGINIFGWPLQVVNVEELFDQYP